MKAYALPGTQSFGDRDCSKPGQYWTGDDKTPTKLPAEIIKKILEYSSEKKDLVLDPFLGSGQVAVISKMLGRQYLGFEIVKQYYDFANKRLQKNVYRLKKETKN